MKKLVALLLVLCLAFSSVAISAADEPFVINACIASEPETIDPSLISSVDGSTYTQHQFENLMKYQMVDQNPANDPNMKLTEVVKGQAKDYTISWVFSWQRLVDPATASDYGYFLDNIVLNAAAIQAGEKDKSELGIKALDDKTLEITLEAPCAYFLEMCAFASPGRQRPLQDHRVGPRQLHQDGEERQVL